MCTDSPSDTHSNVGNVPLSWRQLLQYIQHSTDQQTQRCLNFHEYLTSLTQANTIVSLGIKEIMLFACKPAPAHLPKCLWWFVCHYRCFTFTLCHYCRNKAFYRQFFFHYQSQVLCKCYSLFFIVHLKEERGCRLTLAIGRQNWKQLQGQETVSIGSGFPFLCSHSRCEGLPSLFVICCKSLLPAVYSVLSLTYEGFYFFFFHKKKEIRLYWSCCECCLLLMCVTRPASSGCLRYKACSGGRGNSRKFNV